MNAALERALAAAVDRSEIREIRPVAGGSINEAYYVRTREEQYFIKYRRPIGSGFFRREAEGLERIRATGAIAVPRVYAAEEAADGTEGWLVLEWIEGRPSPTTEAELGAGVARLHRTVGDRFGLESDGWIGSLPQPNRWYERWTEYYRECRLLPQIRLAEARGRLPDRRRRRLIAIVDSLERWLPAACAPSLLHGDLWSGNWLAGPQGRPYLIDPSVLYGHHEFELAFTELFGGFSRTFYDAYRDAFPVSPDYAERKPLYQLFYLLVHLNLFGESYGGPIDRILARYA